MSSSRTQVIHAARVFNGAALTDATHVRIEGERIDGLGGPEIVRPEDAIFEAPDATVLPGLIDSHVHLAPGCARLAAGFGVTTLIDQFSRPDVADAEKTAAQAAPYAAIRSSGIGANAPGGHPALAYGDFPAVSAPEDAERFVADRIAEGSDHLKILFEEGVEGLFTLPTVDAATIEALSHHAHDAGMKVVAHVSTARGAVLVAESGVDVLAHVPFAAMSEDELDRVAAANVAAIATLDIVDGFPGPDGQLPVAGTARGRLSPRWLELLEQQARRWMPPEVPDWESAARTVVGLAERGCAILAGTDAPNPGLVFGAGLHRELGHLVAAGLTPTAALTAATSAPASIFELDGCGVIAPGARADILVVQGDPTSDIAATMQIERTWVRGQEVDASSYAGSDEETATLEFLAQTTKRIMDGLAKFGPPPPA